jgi:murein DD-endopeptidase MepM/ murein hydrolase activator NlpD
MRLALVAALALLLAAPAAALAGDPGGGAAAPVSGGGGASYGQAVSQSKPAAQAKERKRRRARSRGPLLTGFRLSRPKLFLYGRPARVAFRIKSRAKTVRVRLYFLRQGGRAPVRTIFLGDQATNTTRAYYLTGLETGLLPQGLYTLKIAAKDARGRRLRRAPTASTVTELSFFHHRFPIAGPFSYSGPDGRFGAPRRGHSHQGQDLPAPEGTPVVAPRGGTVEAVQYQAGGAGHYVVLDGDAEDRDYVFMHLRTGSIVVKVGQHVRTGQRLGDVGSTGESSGPHLHFEIWVGGGWYTGGHPVDPLPYLRTWDRWS